MSEYHHLGNRCFRVAEVENRKFATLMFVNDCLSKITYSKRRKLAFEKGNNFLMKR